MFDRFILAACETNFADVVWKAVVEILHVFLLLISRRLDLVDSSSRERWVRSVGEPGVTACHRHRPRHWAGTGCAAGARRFSAARPCNDEGARSGSSRGPVRRRRRLRCRDLLTLRCLIIHCRQHYQQHNTSSWLQNRGNTAPGSTAMR